ncbi:prolyl 4-hydroxylase subunit alpha [Anopheles sinensis]|uniref:Prolyl 4-hydroxylase subunit alpha n=1 Tax=Anopheles sinensis TaxID=74873 RepID=A0A084VJ14_ANOSI|nr:prolyl 4-hydroxylase subunit alpha [Anopheles sinensis]
MRRSAEPSGVDQLMPRQSSQAALPGTKCAAIEPGASGEFRSVDKCAAPGLGQAPLTPAAYITHATRGAGRGAGWEVASRDL